VDMKKCQSLPSNQPYVYRMGTVRIRGMHTYVNRMHTKCMGEMYGVSPRDRSIFQRNFGFITENSARGAEKA
jgi:hypothetical protein